MNRLDEKYTISPTVEWAESDGEIMVVELEQGQVYSLNDTASIVWQGISDDLSVSQIVERMREQFDVPEETLQSDAIRCVDLLLAKPLILVQ